MKKVFLSMLVVLSLSSCASVGLVGVVYTGVTGPGTATSNTVGSKVGHSQAVSILGIVAVGDAGINKAAKKGGITKISHVDTKTLSILGIFTKAETVVYGE